MPYSSKRYAKLVAAEKAEMAKMGLAGSAGPTTTPQKRTAVKAGATKTPKKAKKTNVKDEIDEDDKDKIKEELIDHNIASDEVERGSDAE